MSTLVVGFSENQSKKELGVKVLMQKKFDSYFFSPGYPFLPSQKFVASDGTVLYSSESIVGFRTDGLRLPSSPGQQHSGNIYTTSWSVLKGYTFWQGDSLGKLRRALKEYNVSMEPHISFEEDDVFIEFETFEELKNAEY